jgi:hypothetical protein
MHRTFLRSLGSLQQPKAMLKAQPKAEPWVEPVLALPTKTLTKLSGPIINVLNPATGEVGRSL